VQEMLCVLFTEREGVLERIRAGKHPHAKAEEVYEGLIAAAFQMRDLTKQDGVAFWTSGYEADRLRLEEAMRRSLLDGKNPEYDAPPHVKDRMTLLQQLWKHQLKTLHEAANTGKVSKAMRKRLLDL
jgi:hypothetical protein